MLNVDTVHVIKHLYFQKRIPIKQIARHVGVSPNTVRKYIRLDITRHSKRTDVRFNKNHLAQPHKDQKNHSDLPSHENRANIDTNALALRLSLGHTTASERAKLSVTTPNWMALLDKAMSGDPKKRRRSLCILLRALGSSSKKICSSLNISKSTRQRYERAFAESNLSGLYPTRRKRTRKSEMSSVRDAVISTLHEPPKIYGINRTTWRRGDLISVLRKKDILVCDQVIREVLCQEGYRWRKAKVVLTSKDPDYREKFENIKDILSQIQQDEAFFSIDEYGPFAVKIRGGKKLMESSEAYTIPQYQKSKGTILMTAALDLKKNQIVHFYSKNKNTKEMITMMKILAARYWSYNKIWLSWDAASWHMSKALYTEIDLLNQNAAVIGGPVIAVAPLPSGAQFLNVIESVFSGLARGVLHNSDYQSVEAARSAIDQYFHERNTYFLENPVRAGNKIWGKERSSNQFDEGSVCKDPSYR